MNRCSSRPDAVAYIRGGADAPNIGGQVRFYQELHSVLVVAETPIRRLVEIPVPAPRPRTRACLARPELVELREQLIGMLRKQVTP